MGPVELSTPKSVLWMPCKAYCVYKIHRCQKKITREEGRRKTMLWLRRDEKKRRRWSALGNLLLLFWGEHGTVLTVTKSRNKQTTKIWISSLVRQSEGKMTGVIMILKFYTYGGYFWWFIPFNESLLFKNGSDILWKVPQSKLDLVMLSLHTHTQPHTRLRHSMPDKFNTPGMAKRQNLFSFLSVIILVLCFMYNFSSKYVNPTKKPAGICVCVFFFSFRA